MSCRFLMNLWRNSVGLPDLEDKPVPNLAEIRDTQWSDRFEMLMRNRLIMGAFRYGMFGMKGKKKFDTISSCIERLKLYQEDGNDEHLVDVANLCLCEFVEGTHPKKHFNSNDDLIHSKEV